MKIRSTLKFQLNDYKYVILGMYVFVYLFMILISSHGTINNLSGMELISLLAVFVLGISSFRPYFHYFSVNGVSRRTLFGSTAAALAIASVLISFIDALNALLFSSFITHYQSMFMQLYYPIDFKKLIDSNTQDGCSGLHYSFPILAQQFLWSVFAYFWIAMIGLFITVLFYRMSKPLKIAVGIGVPVLCFFILPTFDRQFWNNSLSNAIGKFLRFAWGYANGYNPYIGMVSMLILTVIAAALIWLLMRRASLKSK